MHKQILFYSKNYQVGYCPETKSLSQPQAKEFSKSELFKNTALCVAFAGLCWFLIFFGSILSLQENMLYGIIPTILICLLTVKFLKVKMHFEFMLKLIWNIFFVQCFWIVLAFVIVAAVYSENYFSPALCICIYLLVFIMVGVLLTVKTRIKITENSEYVDTVQNKKILAEILKSSRKNYILVRIVGVAALFILPCIAYLSYGEFAYQYLALASIVAVFQKNFYYLSLINEIAEKYDISLKSKDVLAENDAEAEKQVNAENKANEEHGTNTKNISTTENEMNAEINTAKEIVTENKATAKNETNSETNIKSDTNTNTEN